MSLIVDLQITSGHVDWSHLRDTAQWADEQDFGALWIVDHLAGKSMGGEASFEAFSWLGALAASTSRIELGSLVLNVWNRSVGVSVVGAATVAAISGRRFWFGIGAGTSPSSSFAWEQNVVGAPIAERLEDRHDRVIEVLSLADRMWNSNVDDFDTFLQPPHRPVVILGVNSVRLATIAGNQADGVNIAWNHPRRQEFIDATLAACGSRRFELTTYLPWSPELEDPESRIRHEMEAVGISRLILLHAGVPPR